MSKPREAKNFSEKIDFVDLLERSFKLPFLSGRTYKWL